MFPHASVAQDGQRSTVHDQVDVVHCRASFGSLCMLSLGGRQFGVGEYLYGLPSPALGRRKWEMGKMSENSVVEFPFNPYFEKLEEMKRARTLRSVFDCFKYAIGNDLGRAPISQFLDTSVSELEASGSDHQAFVEWFADNCTIKSVASADIIEPVATSPPRNERDCLRNEFFRKVEALGKKAGEAGTASYRWFTPGLEVDSDAWNSIFGWEDPAVVVAEYADQMLEGPGPNEDLFGDQTRLSREDVAILEKLIPLLASRVRNRDFQEIAQPPSLDLIGSVLRRSLLKAGAAEEACAWFHPTFCEALDSFPKWLVRLLVDYFASLDYHSMEPILAKNPIARKAASNAVAFVESAFLEVLKGFVAVEANSGVRSNYLKPNLRYLSNFIVNMYLLSAEGDVDIGDEEAFSLKAAIYGARPTLFRHVLPFHRQDNVHCMEGLAYRHDLDGKYWLAWIAYSEAEGVHSFSENPYGLSYWYSRTNWTYQEPGQERFALYEQALREILAEGLNVLAANWWAFFVTTQAIIFGSSLGLYPRNLHRVVEIAGSLPRHTSLERAVSYIRDAARRDRSLQGQATWQAFANISLSRGEVIEVPENSERSKEWLKGAFGSEVWDALEGATRRDLIDAEESWSRMFRDLGARRDWGSIAFPYIRSIERELRAKLIDLFELASGKWPLKLRDGRIRRIEKNQPPDLNLMCSYVVVIGKQTLPQLLAEKIKLLTKMFDANGKIQAWRNNTVHGNKDLDDAAWLEIRALVIREQVLSCVSSVSREYLRLQRRRSELVQCKQCSDTLSDADQIELEELESFLTAPGKN